MGAALHCLEPGPGDRSDSHCPVPLEPLTVSSSRKAGLGPEYSPCVGWEGPSGELWVRMSWGQPGTMEKRGRRACAKAQRPKGPWELECAGAPSPGQAGGQALGALGLPLPLPPRPDYGHSGARAVPLRGAGAGGLLWLFGRAHGPPAAPWRPPAYCRAQPRLCCHHPADAALRRPAREGTSRPRGHMGTEAPGPGVGGRTQVAPSRFKATFLLLWPSPVAPTRPFQRIPSSSVRESQVHKAGNSQAEGAER